MAIHPLGPRCSYTAPDGQICPHMPDENKSTCIFHTPREEQTLHHRQYAEEVRKLFKTHDAYLKGFIFPKGTRLEPASHPKEGVSAAHLTVKHPIDISYSDFIDTDILRITFEEDFIARDIHTQGYFNLLECNFSKSAHFDVCEFESEMILGSSFLGPTRFFKCNFFSRTEFRGNFRNKTVLNGSVFYDGVSFRGQRIFNEKIGSGVAITIKSTGIPSSKKFPKEKFSMKELWIYAKSKATNGYLRTKVWFKKKSHEARFRISRKISKLITSITEYIEFECFQLSRNTSDYEINSLFHNEVNFQEVDFRRPERVNFFNVDLTKTRVIGTDFSGVQFYDVKWFQPRLSRNGLYEEVELLDSNDKDTERFKRPQLEKAYRNIRVSLENQKEYDTASDFLIGEMNYKLLQKRCYRRLFSILGIYKLLSLYGTSPTRIIFPWITLLLALHILITAHINHVSIFSAEICEFVLRTLKLATLQKVTETPIYNISQESADFLLRFLSPVLLALLALTIRARIKRF